MARSLPLALLALAFAGCGGDADPAAWEGPPSPAPDGMLAVDGFDAYAAEVDEPWERAPLLVGIEFLRVEEREPGPAEVALDLPPEGAEQAELMVTFDRLLDDSVRAERFVIALDRRDDGTWRLASARRDQRCHAGRGHQDFSPEVCF